MNVKFERIKTDIKRSLSTVLLNLEYNSVILETINLSHDLKYLNVEISAINGITEEWVAKLNKNIHLISSEFFKSIKLKNFPKLRFSKDPHEERIKRITKIIDSVQEDLKHH